MTRALFSVLLLLWPVEVHAALPAAALASAGVTLPADARLPLAVSAPDSSGRVRTFGNVLDGHPGFVLFADYTCKTLCGPALVLLGSALERSRISPNDYRVIVIGLDPKDSAADAERMAKAEVPQAVRANAVFLLPDARNLAVMTGAVGFHFVYDKTIDQFAHPEIAYAVAADGRVLRLLSPLALTVSDIRTALSGPPDLPQTLYGRLRVLCYRFAALTGVHTAAIELLLKAAAAVTVMVMAGALCLMLKRRPA